jgi:hypothetical protein
MPSCTAVSLHQAGPVQQVKVQHNAGTTNKGFGFITYAELVRATSLCICIYALHTLQF